MSLVGTNLELFGSDLESRIRHASAGGETAFAGLDRSRSGIYVWRVNKFALDRIEPDGLFHTGDSYVVLRIQAEGDIATYAVHFWLGSETSQDEAGTAAYKAVELDTLLGGMAVQYRELQYYESDIFKSYFRAGLRYADGGNQSGFHHVQKLEYPTLLYWIHDDKVKQIPLVIDSITQDDVFILDEGNRITIYRGDNANHKEALLAEYEALDIKSVRPGTKIVHAESASDKKDFLDRVGRQNTQSVESKCYRIKDNSETLEEIDPDDDLMSIDTYLFRIGSQVWIWLGSRSAVGVDKAWQYATKLAGLTDRLQLVREGHEPETFWVSR